MSVEVGEKAPKFTLPSDSWDNEISHESQRQEGPVILFFYPGDWSRSAEIRCSNSRTTSDASRSTARRCSQSAWTLPGRIKPTKAYAEERGLTFPLLSDFQRKVVEDYGVLLRRGFAERAYFVIDGDDVVRGERIEAATSDKPELDEIIEDLTKAL